MPRDWECLTDPNEPANLKCLEDLFANTVAIIVSLAGLALFVMLVIGGYMYLTAGADAQQTEKARATMFWAIAGIVLMILSFIILRAIQWFTGVNVLEFRIEMFS